MDDESTVEQTFIYRLSEKPGLAWFKNLIFVSSNQDAYTPFDSARIQLCQDALNDNKSSKGNGQQYIQMSWNLLNKLQTKLIYRVDVDFQIQSK
jgi:hypothetical protein